MSMDVTVEPVKAAQMELELEKIGIQLLTAYPVLKIESTKPGVSSGSKTVGKKPWSVLTSRISQKIRTLRMERARGEKLDQAWEKLDMGTVIAVMRPKRELALDYEKDLEKANAIKGKLLRQLSQKNPSDILVTSYLKDTFGLRTSFIASGACKSYLFEAYPCLWQSKYVLFELVCLIGRNKLAQLEQNTVSMLQRIKAKEHLDFPLQCLQKLMERFCTKKAPFFLAVCKTDEEYQDACQCIRTSSPKIVIRVEGSDEIDYAIPCFGGVITSMTDLANCIVTFFAVHIMLEMNYSSGFRHLLHVFESLCFGYEVDGMAKKHKSYLTELKLIDISHD